MVDKQIKVLLIEDNPGDVRLIEEMLSDSGVDGTRFDVENACRLTEGLTRIRKGGIDAVLLDLGLPDSSGLGTFEKVYEQAPEVPVVMLTGRADMELALEGMRMGAQDYLVKGRVDGDLLARTLRYAIERMTAEARIKHLNSVLKAIRNVNQLIVTETKSDSLLRKSCDALVDARDYDAAWLGLLEDGERFATVIGSGFPDDVSRFSKHVISGDHPPCIRDALQKGEMVLVLDKSRECGDCFFKDACRGKEAAIIRVEYADRFFGLLAVLLASGVAVDNEEKGLLAEVASDMGIALHNRELADARKVAEEALLESEERFRMMFENMGDAVVVYDAVDCGNDFIFKDFNRAAEKIERIQREDLIGKSVLDVFRGVADFGLFDVFQRVWQTGEPEHLPTSIYKDGTTTGWKENYVYKLPSGEIVAIYEDVTERKAAEEALLESEKRLQLIAENMPVMLDAFDDKGNIIVWNSECENVTGFNSREIINNPKASKMLYPDDDYENYIHSKLMGYGGNFRNLEWDITCKDGSTRTILWSNMSDKYPIPGWHSWAIGTDITERKAAEEGLRVAGERFKMIVETAPSILMISDARGKNTYVSPNCKEFTGYDPDELTGGMMQWVHGDDAKRAKDVFDRTFCRGVGCKDFEYKAVKKHGDVWCASSSWEPLIDAKGKFRGVISQTIDITERKVAEDALLESEGKYRSLMDDALDTSDIGLFILDDEFKVVWINRSTERYFGLKRDAVIGKDKRQLIRKQIKYIFEDPETFEQKVFATYDDNTHVENFECHVLPGEERQEYWLEHWSQPIRSGLYKGGRIEHYSDITGLKAAADALKDSERRYKHLYSMVRLMCDNLPDLIWTKDMNGKFIFVNKACCDILLNAIDTDEPIEKDDIYFARREREAHPENPEYHTFGESCIRSDAVVLETKEPQRFDEFGNLKGEFVYLDTYKAPFWGEEHNMMGIVGCSRVVTKERAAEDQIKRSLQEKEVLLREIHHRVKNNLQVVSSLLNMQARNVKDKGTIKILSEARDRIRTMSLIHSQLYEGRDLAEINMKGFVDVLLGQLLQSYPVGDTRIVNVVRVDDYPFLISTAVPVGLIINELLSNALKHAFKGKDEGKIEVRLTASEGGRINLTVSDDGVGMPPGFDINESKTLGLRLVKILSEDQLQGTLEVTSDRGATFGIEFEMETG
ncbi:hypothetical protein DRO03_00545 [Methanosarcinales archaeon]|nr:MAG: hypothetical protein DRO03_00545 [Methanosarcinales archaeon]